MNDSTTTTATPQHSAGALAHGLSVVVAHMLDHELPAPMSISAGREQGAVRIVLATVDVDPWTATLHVDDIRHLDRLASTHIVYRGRTPDGVRVELVTVTPRLTRAALSVVPA